MAGKEKQRLRADTIVSTVIREKFTRAWNPIGWIPAVCIETIPDAIRDRDADGMQSGGIV
ncbi:hypothetical protein RvY_14191 [Ramazzottius varieornatus]|uniref:Uncharacterized protein n=1 Tax=Ramazzottius varieornatus TaxID=947166 RepID=A0A1D1VUB2_RAMVA|nr:hypothetical protein RvY_14191 [Ramazzottius varieornatus]